MTTWSTPIRPYRVAGLYVGGLVAIVAFMAFAPFSNLLLGLFIVWLGVFFAVALCVIVVTYSFLALAIFRFIVGGIRRIRQGVSTGKPSTTKPAGGGMAGTWDRWMDGVGG